MSRNLVLLAVCLTILIAGLAVPVLELRRGASLVAIVWTAAFWVTNISPAHRTGAERFFLMLCTFLIVVEMSYFLTTSDWEFRNNSQVLFDGTVTTTAGAGKAKCEYVVRDRKGVVQANGITDEHGRFEFRLVLPVTTRHPFIGTRNTVDFEGLTLYLGSYEYTIRSTIRLVAYAGEKGGPCVVIIAPRVPS